MRYSIIIPTMNHLDDFLRPCIETLIEKTDLSQTEVIIIANGCTDGTVNYITSLPEPFRGIIIPDVAGFPKAINEGIVVSTGEYIVLLNNDVILLDWGRKNEWMEMLELPFLQDKAVGITGPVKFHWDCGATTRTAIAFWCAMIKREVFDTVGVLDEIFTPGCGEDGDLCIKAENYGYKLVQVPHDDSRAFGTGGTQLWQMPILHKGSGTFMDMGNKELLDRNMEIIRKRWGNELETAYHWCHTHPSDMNTYMPVIRKYSRGLKHITEFGTRGCVSLYGMMAEKPARLITYDVDFNPNVKLAARIAGEAGVEFEFRQQDVTTIDNFETTDLLFIDTEHFYQHVLFLLNRFAGHVQKYILIHDTTQFGDKDEIPTGEARQGVFNAIMNFLSILSGQDWYIQQRIEEGPGMTVLARKEEVYQRGTGEEGEHVYYIEKGYPKEEEGRQATPVYSILIPTYNHCDDLLKPCLESIFKYTDSKEVEIVIVANGCKDNTKEYVQSLPRPEIHLVWSDEGLGFAKAVNLGLDHCRGQFIILLNNDVLLLEQPVNQWIQMLVGPMLKDEKVGMTAPLELFDNYCGANVLIFFCVMIRRKLIDDIGNLEEEFWSGGEDCSFTMRAHAAGWKHVVVPEGGKKDFTYTNVGSFPIYHLGGLTLNSGEFPEYGQRIIKENGLKNLKRYNKNIRLNLGSGGIHEPGFISIDLNDERTHLFGDATKIDELFDNGSISEIMAIHLVEHISPFKVTPMFQMWHRLLKPGGKLSIELPDIKKLCEGLLKATKGESYGILTCIYGAVDTAHESKDGRPTGDITSPHLYGWYPDILLDHLWGAGFVNMKVLPEKYPHPCWNFRVECEKPL